MYRILFKGKDNMTLSVAGMSLPANKFVYSDTLPMPLDDLLRACANLSVEVVSERPSIEKDDKELAAATGRTGVRWEGTVGRRYTEYGWFTKDVTRWDLSPEAVQVLSKLSGFVVVTR